MVLGEFILRKVTSSNIDVTTALADVVNVVAAHSHSCDAYLTKPIHKVKLLEVLRKMELID